MGDPIYSVDYHTSALHVDTNSASVSNDQAAVGPYLQVGRNLIDNDGTVLNVLTGWSYVQTRHHSGRHTLVSLSRTDYTYTYDTLFLDPLPGFPFTDPANGSGFGFFLIDPNNPNIAAMRLGRAPRQSARNVRMGWAVGSADLDVDLNEIPIGFEFGRRVGKLEVLLSGGATVNFIGYDLDSRLVWHRTGHGTMTERWSDSGTEVKVGLYAGLVARYPVTDSGRVYLEAHGGYRWVDEIAAQAGFVGARIDPSSWDAGLGLGVIW